MYYNPEIKDRHFGSKWLSLRILASKASLPKDVWGSGGEAPGKIFMTPLKNALVRGGGSQIFEKHFSAWDTTEIISVTGPKS